MHSFVQRIYSYYNDSFFYRSETPTPTSVAQQMCSIRSIYFGAERVPW